MPRRQIVVYAVVGTIGTVALVARLAQAAGAGTAWAIGIAILVLAMAAVAIFLVAVGLAEDVVLGALILAAPAGVSVAAALRWSALPWWAWALFCALGLACVVFLVVATVVAVAMGRG